MQPESLWIALMSVGILGVAGFFPVRLGLTGALGAGRRHHDHRSCNPAAPGQSWQTYLRSGAGSRSAKI